MEFVGHKGAALLDLWSVCHLLFGVALGGLPLWRAPTRGLLGASVLVLLLALSWEAVEYALEAGAAGEAIGFWLQGHEHWLNRLISDPLLVLLGFHLAQWRPDLVWPARAGLLLWAVVFGFVLPHSMAYMG